VRSTRRSRRAAAPEQRIISSIDRLTSREIEVLRHIGSGQSRVEIGKALSRSPKTIDGHQERIMKKLGIESRADLMRFAIREGIAQA
jgi:DNA-binding NarL/FixJ family response regulator